MASPSRALHDFVVEDIGQRIVGGTLPPGATLDLEALRHDLGVSQTAMREALRVLAHKGLIGARTKVGTFVRQQERWNLLDEDVLRWELDAEEHTTLFAQLGEMRELIEPGAAALAAKRRTADHLAAIDESLEGMAGSGGEADAMVDSDLLFHRAVFTASGNSLIHRQGRLIEIGLRARDSFVHERHVSIQLGLDRHVRVADAIRRGDGDSAAEAMRDLIAAATADAADVVADDSVSVARG